MHCHAAINPSISENLPLCIMKFLDNYNYFGYLKGANEVNIQLSASCTIMLDKSTVLCRNMLLCCMYHNIIMLKIMLAYLPRPNMYIVFEVIAIL